MSNYPDILWLSLESVRADHTPMYGYERNTTPSLEDLAEESETTVLDNGIAQSLWTPASSASMLTGTYLSTHRVGQDGKAEQRLSSHISTLPSLLRDVGYKTALFTPNPYLSEATGLDKGFDQVKSVKAQPESYSALDSNSIDYWIEAVHRILRSKRTSVDRIKHELKTTENEVLERNIRQWLKSSQNDSQPFFAYAHIPGPHHPYLPNTEYLESFTDKISFSAEEAYSLVKSIYYGGTENIRKEIASGLDYNSNEWEAIKAMYDATLRHMDKTVSEIISAARKESDSLVIIVVGDHGELFGEQGLLGHNLVLHEKLIRVPMIVSGLSDIETDEEMMSQQIDLTRTIAERIGVVTDQFEGRDLRTDERKYALSQRGVAQLDPYIQFNENFDTSRFFEQPYTIVTDGTYKLATNSDRTELYELPHETEDISNNNEEHRQRLNRCIADFSVEWSQNKAASAADFNDGQIKQLQDLGYL